MVVVIPVVPQRLIPMVPARRSRNFLRLRLWSPAEIPQLQLVEKALCSRGPDGPVHLNFWEFGHCT